MAIFSNGNRNFTQWIKSITRRNSNSGFSRRTWFSHGHNSPDNIATGSINPRRLHNNDSRSGIPTNDYIHGTRYIQSDNNPTYHQRNKRNRYNKYLLPVIAALTCSPTYAADVGGVSATANPIANSSGSVTNQAIQVLQGPYITNTYGNGISCQGPTLNITPFVTHALSHQNPKEYYYDDPVYNNADNDDDGIPDDPGQILYYIPTRTGQKDNLNFNLGISATVSIPLDRQLQDGCKRAYNTQTALQNQILANKRLDFEIARLKNCGELMQAGIKFHPKSPYYSVCADVVVTLPQNGLPNHSHSIPQVTANDNKDEVTTYEIDGDGNQTIKNKTVRVKTSATEVSVFEYDENGKATLIKRETIGPNEDFVFEPISISNPAVVDK